jgi:hypothetical protein
MFQTAVFIRSLACAMVLLPLAAWPAPAQQNAPTPALTLELNGAQTSDKGCRLTFVVNNSLGAELTKAAFEIALFNASGVVDRLTVLDFKELPAGKTKVTRFDPRRRRLRRDQPHPGQQCDGMCGRRRRARRMPAQAENRRQGRHRLRHVTRFPWV